MVAGPGMKGQFEHLLVLHRAHPSGERHVVGRLWRDPVNGFCFAYERDLTAALGAGFAMLLEFPEQRTQADPYVSRHLFSTFAQRVPSPRRADFAEMLEDWGVEHADDAMEILARSGGLLVTDRIELAEERGLDDDLARPLEFRVAGGQHHAAGDQVKPGELVSVKHERQNPFDPAACVVLKRADGSRIGYVPRQYSALVAGLLGRGARLEGTVARRVLGAQDSDRWVVSLRNEDAAAR